MERSITYLRASTNICCVKSTAAQQGERGQAQRSPLESMVRRGDKQMCEAAEGVKRHLVERLSGHPAACTALPCAIPGQPPSARRRRLPEPPQWGLSQAPAMGLIARLGLCRKYKGFFLPFPWRSAQIACHENSEVSQSLGVAYWWIPCLSKVLSVFSSPCQQTGQTAPLSRLWTTGLAMPLVRHASVAFGSGCMKRFIVLGIFLWNIYRGTIFQWIVLLAHAIQMIKMPFVIYGKGTHQHCRNKICNRQHHQLAGIQDMGKHHSSNKPPIQGRRWQNSPAPTEPGSLCLCQWWRRVSALAREWTWTSSQSSDRSRPRSSISHPRVAGVEKIQKPQTNKFTVSDSSAGR